MTTEPLNQTNHFPNNFSVESPANCSQQERGYTIVVPANVCIRGVNMQLDLKLDQKTLEAASGISKAVEEAVSSHFSQGMSAHGEGPASRRAVRVPSSQAQFSFSISEPDSNINGAQAHMDCDSSGQNSNRAQEIAEKSEQVNEVCSSTVDSSPMCDTASSPIEMPPVMNTPQPSASNTESLMFADDQRPSSSAVYDNEVHSSVEDTGDSIGSTSGFDSFREPPTPSSVEEASPSSSAPIKRRRDKTAPPSHFCEQNDPGGKGQCRQRAILSFRYCIRHILLDPNAPYRQCQHKRKPKSKKDTNIYCTNAIRNDKDTVYCSTHMIMKGMMEPRKRKSLGSSQEEVPPAETESPSSAWNEENSSNPPAQQIQPLPSIVHCGFEHSQGCINDDSDRWTIDRNSVNSPVVADVQQTMVDQYPGRGQTPFLGNAFPNPPAVVQRNASYPPSVPTPSNLSSGSFDEPFSLPANSSHIVDDSPCSSSMVSPSPSKKMLVGQRALMSSPQFGPASSPVISHPQAPVSNLTKQHPQLAAKLLQTTASAPSFPTAAMVTPSAHPSIAPPLPGTVARAEVVKRGQPPVIVAPHNAVLPWSAPLLLQRPPSVAAPNYYNIDDIDDEGRVAPSPALPKKKVIRLKQKRQRMKMIGPYRKIAAVDQMCKILEDYDFDRTDLFPLGLEPSDDEGSSDNEPIQWPAAMEGRSDERRSSGALELYLLKKQLRLDRHTLIRQAQINAPIMHASKRYPNSVGMALTHRASRNPPRPPSVRRRCTHMISNGRSPPERCTERCLPMSNHCVQHVLYNINQRLFSYCSESCCGQPVLCVDAIVTSGLCKYHYELSQQKQEAHCASIVDEKPCVSSAPFVIPPISSLQQPASEPFGMPQMQQINVPQTSQLPCVYKTEPSQHIQNTVDPHPVGDFSEAEVNETDVSLASVAKELGFDGRELSDMLAGLPAGDEDPGDILHQQFTETLKDEDMLGASELDEELGHSWADVEQFLLSEGYPVVLTPPSYGVDSPSAMPAHSSNGSVGSYAPSPAPVPAQQPRPQPIPAADSLLPHRS